jgi:hypothetical protein
MGIIKIPKPLREKLGDDGTEGLIEVMNKQEEQTKDLVIQTAVERFERRLTEVESGLHSRISDVEKRFERRLTEEVSGLRVEIHKSKSDTIKWMFIFYIGQVAALGGILFAVLR